MNLRDILVLLDGNAASDERLRLAVTVAKEHNACLSAVFLEARGDNNAVSEVRVPQLGLMVALRGSGAGEAPRGMVFSDTVERQFRESVRSFGGDGEWHPLDIRDTAQLVALGRSVDLIIAGQANSKARYARSWRPDDIVLACGRPVLVVPYIGSYRDIGHRVLVAWDGSREAARAINDALPVISPAGVVTVVTVTARANGSLQDHRSIDRIVRHLSRHHVDVRAEETLRGSNAVSDVLLSRAADFAADLIVAGAYHHSPLREALIGGVSRGLFEHMTVPVLMSH